MKTDKTSCKFGWLDKLLDVALTMLGGYGVCALAFFLPPNKDSSPVAGVIALFIWAIAGAFFWAPKVQTFHLQQKIKFYIVLLISSLFFIAHSNSTLEERGFLFFRDLRFIMPHYRPDASAFIVVTIDSQSDETTVKDLAFRQQCGRILEQFESAKISPLMAVMAENLTLSKDPSAELSHASRMLARIIGRQQYPVLLREDHLYSNDSTWRDYIFYAEMDSILNDDGWDGRTGYLYYHVAHCCFQQEKGRTAILGFELKKGQKKHLSLLAAESLNRLSNAVNVNADRLMDYPRQKVDILKSRAIIEDEAGLEMLNKKIIVFGYASDTLANETCSRRSHPISHAEAFVYSSALLMQKMPIRELSTMVVFLVYMSAITLNLYIFVQRKALGFGMIQLYLIEFVLFHFFALTCYALLNFWSDYHYFFFSIFFSFIIYRIGESRDEQAA
jgi:hypothetical protein